MSDNLQLLTELCDKPDVCAWFKGLFRRAHMQVTDTNEAFTFEYDGDKMTVTPGLTGDKPNFVIPLQSENIRNLSGFFSDGAIGPQEEYRIVKFMLMPCLKAALAMPILNNAAFRAVVRIDDHWQEAIKDPQGNEDEQTTVVHVNDQWLAIPGYVGKPKRRLVMTPAQALDFQRRVLAADDGGGIGAWIELANWYKGWREQVSVAV